MCTNVLPKYVVSENAIEGIIMKVVEYLLPMNAVRHVKKKLPVIQPIEKNADTQEISSLVKGPAIIGPSDALNIGIIGAIQPLAKPAQIFMRLTELIVNVTIFL